MYFKESMRFFPEPFILKVRRGSIH